VVGVSVTAVCSNAIVFCCNSGGDDVAKENWAEGKSNPGAGAQEEDDWNWKKHDGAHWW